MCGMKWPLGGKVEWEIKCNSVFSEMLLSGIYERYVVNC